MLRGRDLVFVATVGTTAVALVIAVTLGVIVDRFWQGGL